MKELITEEQAVRIIRLIAVLTPPLGLLAGVVRGLARRRERRLYLVYGLLAGLSGPVILLMWSLYNGLVEHYGLDSVKGLLVELAVFLAAGSLLGVLLSLLLAVLKRGLGSAVVKAPLGRRGKKKKPSDRPGY